MCREIGNAQLDQRGAAMTAQMITKRDRTQATPHHSEYRRLISSEPPARSITMELNFSQAGQRDHATMMPASTSRCDVEHADGPPRALDQVGLPQLPQDGPAARKTS